MYKYPTKSQGVASWKALAVRAPHTKQFRICVWSTCIPLWKLDGLYVAYNTYYNVNKAKIIAVLHFLWNNDKKINVCLYSV